MTGAKFIISCISNFSTKAMSFCFEESPESEIVESSSTAAPSFHLCPRLRLRARNVHHIRPTCIHWPRSPPSHQRRRSPPPANTECYPYLHSKFHFILRIGFWLIYIFTPCPTRTANPTFTYLVSCLPKLYMGVSSRALMHTSPSRL